MTTEITSPDKPLLMLNGYGDNQLLSASKSINDSDKTGRLRLFPPTDATYSLFSENNLLLDQD